MKNNKKEKNKEKLNKPIAQKDEEKKKKIENIPKVQEEEAKVDK